VLGLYVYDTESSSNWSMVLEDLKQRGVENVLFFCVDGLKGFPQAVEGAFPKAILQRCIVHMVRTSARFVSDKDLKKVCADLRKVYTPGHYRPLQQNSTILILFSISGSTQKQLNLEAFIAPANRQLINKYSAY
jgi:putative transposase